LRPEADVLLTQLHDAEADGLEPAGYRPEALTTLVERARAGERRALSAADRALSAAYLKYALDLRRPVGAASLQPTDAELDQPEAGRLLQDLANAPDLTVHLQRLRSGHPEYQALKQALAAYRARWGALPATPVPAGKTLAVGASGARVKALRQRLGLPEAGRYDAAVRKVVREFQTAHGLKATGAVDAPTLATLNEGPTRREALLRANLERARALPTDGRKHLVVDAAGAELRLYEDGELADRMRVIVGKPESATPMMSGLMRYVVFRPYWNIPEDLARDRVAKHVREEGLGYLKRERMEVLSDWSDEAVVVDPKTVDWAGVASGRVSLRARQLPGPDNMMGQVKFMLPNDLGIYLHDTPGKVFFKEPVRTFSAGCVRVEDADRLARWLLPKEALARGAKGGPEQRVDLTAPVPVYITYFTAAPAGEDGLTTRADVYGRDAPLLAALQGRAGGGARLAQR
jgi:L,D-transpeptidase YcbB